MSFTDDWLATFLVVCGCWPCKLSACLCQGILPRVDCAACGLASCWLLGMSQTFGDEACIAVLLPHTTSGLQLASEQMAAAPAISVCISKGT